MLFSKVVLFAISLGAISVLATPHALHHHALHRRVVAARVASTSSNSSVAVNRKNSAKCSPRSSSSSSSTPSTPSPTIPAVSAIAKIPKSTPSPSTSSTLSPTPQQQPPSTTSTAAQGTQSPTNGADGPFFGDGTFFATGLGACGITNTDADFIVAVSEIRFDAAANGPDPNSNPLCGQKVSISFGGHTGTATIVDRCTGCSKDSLDMTPDLFQVFAALGVGRIHNIEWSFIN